MSRMGMSWPSPDSTSGSTCHQQYSACQSTTAAPEKAPSHRCRLTGCCTLQSQRQARGCIAAALQPCPQAVMLQQELVNDGEHLHLHTLPNQDVKVPWSHTSHIAHTSHTQMTAGSQAWQWHQGMLSCVRVCDKVNSCTPLHSRHDTTQMHAVAAGATATDAHQRLMTGHHNRNSVAQHISAAEVLLLKVQRSKQSPASHYAGDASTARVNKPPQALLSCSAP